MNIYIVALVIFLTALLAFTVTGCLTARPVVLDDQEAGPGPLPGELPAAGRFELPGPHDLPPGGGIGSTGAYLGGSGGSQMFLGASLTGQPDPIPWDLAGAAYQLGQMRASQDDITRQVDAIMAEVELHPERWRR